MHGCYNNYKSTARATEPPVNSNSGNEQLAIFPETLHIQSQGQGPAWIKYVFSTQTKVYLPLGLPIRCHGNFCKNACWSIAVIVMSYNMTVPHIIAWNTMPDATSSIATCLNIQIIIQYHTRWLYSTPTTLYCSNQPIAMRSNPMQFGSHSPVRVPVPVVVITVVVVTL